MYKHICIVYTHIMSKIVKGVFVRRLAKKHKSYRQFISENITMVK